MLALSPPSYSAMKTWHSVTMTMQEVNEWEWNGLANVGGVSVASVGQMQFGWANDFRKPFSRLYFCVYFLGCFSQGKREHRAVKAAWPSEEPSWETVRWPAHCSTQCSASLVSLILRVRTQTSPQLGLVLETLFQCGCGKKNLFYSSLATFSTLNKKSSQDATPITTKTENPKTHKTKQKATMSFVYWAGQWGWG